MSLAAKKLLCFMTLAIGVLLAALAPLHAAETPTITDADRSYLELRKSKDRASQLLAERWNGATSLQEWTDMSGKFKTTAKYVEHDPELKWVKLRVIQGTGEKRVVKDVQVPVDKLNKTSQSRVRQIATLKDKVAAAIAADTEDAKEGKEDESRGEPGAAAEAVDERGLEGRGEGRRPGEATHAESEAPQASPASTAPSGDGPPALQVPSESNTPPVATTEAAAATSSSSPIPEGWDRNRPLMPDNDPWRTDYEVLTRAFERDETDGFIRTLDESPAITNLQIFTPNTEDGASIAVGEFTTEPRLVEIGEFMWEATVAKEPSADADWAEVFALPPMLAPLRIELRLDRERGAGNWEQLKVGDRVKFIGRFIGYKGTFVWVAAIRFPDDLLAPVERR